MKKGRIDFLGNLKISWTIRKSHLYPFPWLEPHVGCSLLRLALDFQHSCPEHVFFSIRKWFVRKLGSNSNFFPIRKLQESITSFPQTFKVIKYLFQKLKKCYKKFVCEMLSLQSKYQTNQNIKKVLVYEPQNNTKVGNPPGHFDFSKFKISWAEIFKYPEFCQ